MPTIDAQTFRLRREALGLSQEALHEISGIGLMTIRRIEASSGGRSCRTHTLRRLASALSISAIELEYDGLEHTLDFGGDVEVRLSKATNESEIREGAEALTALILNKLRLLKNDPD